MMIFFPMFVLQLSNTYNTSGHYFSTTALARQSLNDEPLEAVIDIPLAQTGEGIAECELLKWFVQEVGFLLQINYSYTMWKIQKFYCLIAQEF